jgi:general secretion pathway protein N
MSRTKTFILFAIAYGITLLITAPASLLGAWIRSQTHGTVELSGTHGTIWHGSAVPLFYAFNASPIPLERVNWQISLFPLIQGQIDLLVDKGSLHQAQAAEINIGIRKIELRHVSFEMPATVLGEAHPLLRAISPQGSLQLTSDHLVFLGHAMQGAATVKWLSAGSSFSTINPIGSYLISLDGADNKIAIKLTTISGPLLLQGQGVWSSDHGLSFQASAKASPGSEEALAELLHHLGPESSPGTRLIKIGQAI